VPGVDAADVLQGRLPPGRRVPVPGRGDPWVWDSGEGSGPPVVLLHGWTSTAALTWQMAMAPLAEHHRVIAPDLRGHGRGIRGRPPFRLEACADDVAGLIDVLGCGPCTVVGYSMGGPVAQLLWRRRPELVRSLVLCATATRFAPRTVQATALAATALGLSLATASVPTVLRTAGMRQVAASFPRNGERREGFAAREWAGADPAGLLGAGAALLRFDSSGWIGEVDVPTTVIVTELDETVPPAQQRRLAAAIPSARVITVRGGHRSCVEQPRRFVPALLDACRPQDR
jgi:3-oxoadipate enol-lactonase